MLRRTPVLAVLLSLAITFIGMAPTQAAAPDVTSITSSKPTIYPSINQGKWAGSTTITIASADPSAVEYLSIRNAGDTVVRQITVSGSTTTTWNGRDTGGALVPAGTYTLIALNSALEAATTTGTVNVSRQHLVRKTFTKNIAANKTVFRYAGKCSTLRKPSKRGWVGSLGFYSNTKCKTQTWAASAVITVSSVALPVAARYVDLHIDTYGGAAKAKPGSRGVIEYWSASQQNWTAGKFIASSVGWHNGLTRNPTSLVYSGRWIDFRFSTAYKAQYDVAKYRVVAHYDVLSAS